MTLFCDFLKVRDHLERPLKFPQCTQRVFGKIKHNRIGSKEYLSAISVIPTVGGGEPTDKFKKIQKIVFFAVGPAVTTRCGVEKDGTRDVLTPLKGFGRYLHAADDISIFY